jgi:biotin carboxylase
VVKAIIFLGTQKSGSSREAIRAAEQLGYYTVLFTERRNYLEQRSEFPDVHYMQLCDLNNPQDIKLNLMKLHQRDIESAAIVSFTDAGCLMACMIAEEIGLNHFSCHAIRQMNNKIISREILSQTEYSSGFMTLSANPSFSDMKHDINFTFPFVIKSPNSTGSADVFRIHNDQDLNYYLALLERRHPGESILVEELLDGPQYLVEVLVHEKNVLIAAVVEQEVTFYQRFIITGYNLLLELPEHLQNLPPAVESIVKTHGMEAGACHLELRLVDEKWKLVEINPRISGGAMNRLIKYGLGINLVQETLRMALGEEPDLIPQYKRNMFVQYLTVSQSGILEKVTGMNRALRSEGVQEVFVRPRKGARLKPPLSMGNRYAYVIATGDSEENARDNAKIAAAQIQFRLRNTTPDEPGRLNRIAEKQFANPHNTVRFNRQFHH